MEKKRDKQKLNRGMVTIEATISLTTFVFTILMILSILNICTAQAKIGIAINSTAKELSQYSYLYAITGINNSVKKVADSADETKETVNTAVSDVNSTLSTVNSVFTEIQNLGSSGSVGADDVTSFLSDMDSDYSNIKDSAGKLKTDFEAIASDPKKLAMGIAKIAAVDGLNVATSRLIAGPLSRALCKKNLVAAKGGDVDAYLKYLGVVPASNGSYYDGLDFSKSTIFPSGSSEIRVVVTYEVKVLPLLPIDYKFKFTQTAVTQGWLAGESSYQSTSEQLDVSGNDSIWITATITERSELIRHQAIADLTDEGYVQTKNLTDVQLYNPTSNEFVSIFSMNPLYSAEGERNLTLDDISEEAIESQISELCGKIQSSTDSKKEVETKKKNSDGSSTKATYDCTNASQKIIIVIPEDEGLKAKMEEYLAKVDTKGVTVEFQASYGTGVRNVTASGSDSSESSDDSSSDSSSGS